MPELCLFCDNNSGSKEHLWPKWIHERKDFEPLNFQLGGSGKKVIPDPEITVKTVCEFCNNGWMSDLEAENIPTIGSMLRISDGQVEDWGTGRKSYSRDANSLTRFMVPEDRVPACPFPIALPSESAIRK